MRFKRPIIAVSTVGLLALAACGGSSTSSDSGTPGGTDTSVSGPQGAAGKAIDQSVSDGPAPEIDGAQAGGTITAISALGLNTMDPTEAYYTNTASILSALVTRSLTQYVYRDGDMVLIPDLATKWSSNDDYTEWTFTIRDDVKYENGDPVTPEDIAFGIKRSFDRATFPEGANYSNAYFKDGDTYEGPYKSGDKYSGVKINGQDLTITMSKPFPDMPYWGAFPAIGPIPEGSVSNPANYSRHPLSTGPYMFKDYVPEKKLTLVKNPNWDPATDPGRHQYADEFDMTFDTPTAKLEQLFLNDTGDAQSMLSDNSISVDNYLDMKDTGRLVVGSTPCSYYWAPDYRKITDIDVRKALAYAYPYKDAWAAAGLIEGVTRSPGTNMMPPGIPGRKEYNPLPGHEPGTTDTAKAKELLDKAGKTGYEISFLFSQDDPGSVDAKDAIVKSLEEAGFTTKPYATTLADNSTLRADPNTDINVRSVGWCSDWPTGSSWFPPLFETKNLEKEGLGSNYAVFSEPAVDKKIADIEQMPIEEQPAAWNDLDKFIAEKYFPTFSTGYTGVALLEGSKINGFEDDTVFGEPTWKDLWLTQ
ncbi:MAG: ABC transporter substrate-binding protein [Nocardioidaceae bacterium]